MSLSDTLDRFNDTNDINLQGGSVIGVQSISFGGASTSDGISTQLTAAPTAPRIITLPDRDIEVNAAADLSGSTLPTSIVNSNIQKLGTQAENLDMGGYALTNVASMSTTDSIYAPVVLTPGVRHPEQTGTIIVGGNSAFSPTSAKIQEVLIAGATISKQSANPLTISSIDNTGGNQTISMIGNISCNNYSISNVGDLSCTNLTVSGTNTVVHSETVTIKDNVILINSTQTGTPASTLKSGLEVCRGSLANYQFLFRESDDSFCIGQPSDLQPVATRQDAPTNTGVAIWNSATSRFETSSALISSNIATTTALSTALSGLTTANITEHSSQQYFTNARALTATAGVYEVPLTFSNPLSKSGSTVSLSSSLPITNITGLTGTGFLKVGTAGALSVDTGNYQTPLAFSGGLTNSSGTVTADTTQNISRLSNIATAGFVKSSVNGTLSVDTVVYDVVTSAGTGLTRSGNAYSVNTTQNISRLSNITTAGFVKSSVNGTLSVDTGIYDVVTSAGTGLTRTGNAYSVNQSQNITTLSNLTGAGSALLSIDGSGVLSRNSTSYLSTLSGDVSTSGSTATIAAGAVSLSKMAGLASNSLIGNNTGASATPTALSASAVRSLLGLSTNSDVSFNIVSAALNGNASSATTVGTTKLGRTGNVGITNVTDQASFAALPVGFSGMLSVVTTPGAMPNTSGNFHFHKLSNRDFEGGWIGLSMDWNNGPLYHGRALTSGDFATWKEVVDTASTQTLTNKSIVATQLTGTIAAARMPALSGDVGMNAGTTVTSISNLALSKLATIGPSTLLGNSHASNSVSPSGLSAATVRSMLSLGANGTSQLGDLTLAGLDPSSGASLTMKNDSVIQTSTTAGNRIRFQAYNTDTSSYTEMFRMSAGPTPSLDFNSNASITLGLSPITTAFNTLTLSNKTLDTSCVLGGVNGLSISGASLTSETAYGSISLTCKNTANGTLSISDSGDASHNARMTFGRLRITASDIETSSGPIGFKAEGANEIYLNSPVNAITVANAARLNGAIYLKPEKASGNYTLSAGHTLIISQTNLGPVTINLLSVSSVANRYLIINNLSTTATNKTTIQPASGDTIDGSASSHIMSSSYQSITLVAVDGIGWMII